MKQEDPISLLSDAEDLHSDNDISQEKNSQEDLHSESDAEKTEPEEEVTLGIFLEIIGL